MLSMKHKKIILNHKETKRNCKRKVFSTSLKPTLNVVFMSGSNQIVWIICLEQYDVSLHYFWKPNSTIFTLYINIACFC